MEHHHELSTSSQPAPGLVAGAHDATSLAARRYAFRALYERGCFVIPNPWDVDSARYLQHLGFPALATTSAGFAFSQGHPDTGDDAVVTRERNLAYIASAVDLPLSADFMSGYGLEPEDVAESVTQCVATGVAGLSVNRRGARTNYVPYPELNRLFAANLPGHQTLGR